MSSNAPQNTTTASQDAGLSTATNGVHSASWRCARVALFAALLCVAAAAGRITIPGTPVGITLQTFVLMLAALTMSPAEAGSSALLYLLIGALGAPVFSNGASTAALVGPSAGFLYGFVPAAIITSAFKSTPRTPAPLTIPRDLIACIAGCILVPFVVGVGMQSAITGADLRTLVIASSAFFVGDAIKACVATGAIASARLAREAVRHTSADAVRQSADAE